MSNQYLTFTLNESLYAVNVTQVREVLEYRQPQELPCPDPVIAGLIRSRGQSISVVNMRRKFGFPDAEATADTRIIVLEINTPDHPEKTALFGAVADSVNEVMEIDASAEETPPEVGNSIASEFISGIGQHGEQFIIMLDINYVFTFEEIQCMNTAAAADAAERKA
ncbi:chemotaxis protein CheW [Treponema brennaborense]|uniref:CheW protein n=1 Tax=Treponema brennaborense (strain DSM 12168 / CIP 105900 / DD5/3) TaxID=906968 RepID=F4LKU4_TREBD|nr:chemotaxis protein CheW [Treponema brennaborense]AEE15555.1 CheW protein [Treponema brennaborense DSM 12168]